MKRILLVLALLLSGLAYGQNTVKKIETLCGYQFTEIQDLLKGAGSEFSYKSSEITTQLNAGFFDSPGVSPLELKDARKMCILLYELTGLENKSSDAAPLASLIVDRYGTFSGKSIANSKKDLSAAIVSGKALQIINNFWKSTGRIWTTKLPDYYKTYEPSVYTNEYSNSMTAADGRAKLATQIDSFVTTYPTQTIIETVTVDNTITQDQIDGEGEHLYKKKIGNVKDFVGQIKGKQSCTEINDLSTYLESITLNGSNLVLGVVTPLDGTVNPVKKSNPSDYANGVYSQKTYTLTGKDMDAVAKDIVASNPTLLKGISTWKALTDKVASLVAACGKTKNSGSDSDLDAIIKAGSASVGTWFKNWDLCNNIVNTETPTKKDICKQLILEANYSDANAADYGLTDNTGTMINRIEGEPTPIDQLEFYLDAVVVVKNASVDFKQEEIDLTASNPNKLTTDSKPLWSDLEEMRTKVSDAEAAIESMKNYLLNDFYKDDATKNLCFGFQLHAAASTTGANNVVSSISNLTVNLDVDKTIEFFKSYNVVNTNVGKIQKLCVIFNRVKRANVSGYENYKTFAEKLANQFSLDENKTGLMSIGGNGVEQPLETFKKGLADALGSTSVDKNKEIIHWLSFLNGFGDVYDDDYYTDRTTKLEGSDVDYNVYDATTDIIIASSGTGDVVVTNNGGTFDGDKIVTDNKIVATDDNNIVTTDNNIVSSDVSGDFKESIDKFVDLNYTDTEFEKNLTTLLSLITVNLDISKLATYLGNSLFSVIKKGNPSFWLDSLDTSLNKIIYIALTADLSTFPEGCTYDQMIESIESDILKAIIASTDIDQSIKDYLSMLKSKELRLLARIRLVFDYAIIQHDNIQVSKDNPNIKRVLKKRDDNASVSNGNIRRTLVKKSEVNKITTSNVNSVTKKSVGRIKG